MCESIEYWSVLAQYEPKAVVALVAEFTKIAESKINLVDLFGMSKPFTAPIRPREWSVGVGFSHATATPTSPRASTT